MPAMTAIALHGLLEPNRSSLGRLLKGDSRHEDAGGDEQQSAARRISPAPSPPYILDQKSRSDDAASASASASNGFDASGTERRRQGDVAGDYEDEDEDVGFFDPRETRSCSSSAGFGDRSPPPPFLSQTEFYDAREEFFSDGSPSQSSSSFGRGLETELRSLRINLLEETEKRRLAEEDLLHMQNQWQSMAKSLTRLGLSFPLDCRGGNTQLEIDSAALCQEIIVSKAVSEAIEKSLAQAESEAVVDEIVNSKNHEISRLRDRLLYYETVNHEMTQRNQEIIGLARQRRVRRKRKWKLIWGCIGLSFTVGASLLARSYLTDSITRDSLSTSSAAASCDTLELEA